MCQNRSGRETHPRTPRNGARFALRRFVLIAGLLALFVPAARAAETPIEIRERATTRLAQGDYMGAIPDLQQLIQMLGESKEARIVQAMEIVYYHLGVCYFFTGQFAESVKAFQDYLKRYRHGSKTQDASVYIADALRFQNKLKDALKAYQDALRTYSFGRAMKADIYAGMARCHLADGKWHDAIQPLLKVYRYTADGLQQNWAVTMLVTAYFKDLDIEKIYPLMPYLLRPGSFASRSIAFNMAALEAGDALFADEKYRDALWVFRMVYPYDLIMMRSEEHLEYLKRQAERIKEYATNPRELMHLQENIGEVEEEIKVLQQVDPYDTELFSRIARGYMEALRYWEAREMFLYLHSVAEAKLAEESLYLAFQCSSRLTPWDRAYEIGRLYMEKYPAGEYYDALTLNLAQLYAREQNWDEVIRVLTKALEVSPNHKSGAEAMFLIGYASFMQEKFKDAVAWLGKINVRYPGNDLMDEITYWTAMSLQFDANFKDAAAEFDRVLMQFSKSRYVEDSAYRRAVCDYGMGQLSNADRRLRAFVDAYPKSRLAAEATMMRGDIAGAMSKGREAVPFYQQAMESGDINIELYNHCAFQAGQILYDAGDYAAMRTHYEQYIARNREGSNLPLAIYWIGMGLWNSGEQAGSLTYFREAVVKFGDNPKEYGIDMILEEWVGRLKRMKDNERLQGWQDLRQTLAKADADKRNTLVLRLHRVLLFDPDIAPSERQRIRQQFSIESSLAAASPAVLQSMLDLAKERKDAAFALRVARYMIATYTETDYALDARMVLAKDAIEAARASPDAREVAALQAEAVKHLEVVREVFATTSTAGDALVLLGQLYIDQKKYDEALKSYKAVLEVKEWRPLWPEALYGCGEVTMAQREYQAASAYYERIYIMYLNFRAWSAKAYLRRADCLRRLHQDQKAREVLADMVARPELADLPETKTAKDLLAKAGE